MYTIHLRLTGKCVVDFLVVLIKLFRWLLQLRRYEQISIENRHFCSNRVSFTQIAGKRGRHHGPLFLS